MSAAIVQPLKRDPNAWPFTHWSPIVIGHTAVSTAALTLGAVVLRMPKGTKSHRLLGRVWAGTMVAASVTSFGVSGVNPNGLSFIHGLSAYVLVAVAGGVYQIRRRDVASHRWLMKSAYSVTILGVALAVLTPGRRINNMIFGLSKGYE